MPRKTEQFLNSFNEWQQKQTDTATAAAQGLFFSHINELGNDLKEQLKGVDELSSFDQKKVKSLIGLLTAIQNGRYKDAIRQYQQLTSYLQRYVGASEQQALGLKTLKRPKGWSAMSVIPASGLGVGEHLDNLVNYNNKRLADTVRQSWAAKETAKQLEAKIIGTKARRFKDGLINDQKAKSKAAIDTATQHIVTETKTQVYQDNGFSGYQIRATLDYSTTPLCQSLDGKVYAWDDPNGRKPPFHYYCRTVIVPYDKEVERLLAGSTRASWSGAVSNTTTYKDWIKDNPMPKGWTQPARPKRRRNRS